MEENQNLEQVQEEQVEEVVVETTENDEVVEETIEGVVEETTEDTRLAESEAKAAEYLDRWQRLMAEFDNYRKRSEKEKADSYDYAVSNTIVDMLPIIDNFERALKIESADKALFAGVQMIYKQMMGVLERLNVTPIETENKEFDPNLHNAIEHIDDESLGKNIIVEEVQKGYIYKEKVIRYSLVKVAN